MSEPQVISTPSEVAFFVATELYSQITKDQTHKLVALTGGTLGIEVIREFGRLVEGELPARFVFGDERFVDLSDPDRNEHQGLEAWPGLERYLIRYPNNTLDLESARDRFELELKSKLGPEPRFDITILGMGPDGHIASLFPGHALTGELVVAEPDSPKPPAQRLSLSFDALNRSKEVWFVASGSAKADAVRCALGSDCELPVGKVKGQELTRWFIDSELSRAL